MTSGPARTVAIVEDEDGIRESVVFALEREGHAAVGHGDGRQAWAAFEAALPDLAIVDIGLPGMDGLELCRRLRARSEVLPIVFLTSREEEFDRVLGLEIGADDYLCKPFSMRELMARVRVLLRRASHRVDDDRAPAERRARTRGCLSVVRPRPQAGRDLRPLSRAVRERGRRLSHQAEHPRSTSPQPGYQSILDIVSQHPESPGGGRLLG